MNSKTLLVIALMTTANMAASTPSDAHNLTTNQIPKSSQISSSQQKPQPPYPAGKLTIANKAPFVIVKKVTITPVNCKGEERVFSGFQIPAGSKKTLEIPSLEVNRCYLPWPNDTWGNTTYSISIEYELDGKEHTQTCSIVNTNYAIAWTGKDLELTIKGYVGSGPGCTGK